MTEKDTEISGTESSMTETHTEIAATASGMTEAGTEIAVTASGLKEACKESGGKRVEPGQRHAAGPFARGRLDGG